MCSCMPHMTGFQASHSTNSVGIGLAVKEEISITDKPTDGYSVGWTFVGPLLQC